MSVCSFGLAAEQKRTQFKEGAKSMTSTGSGKSSTVSRSVHHVGVTHCKYDTTKVWLGRDTESCYTNENLLGHNLFLQSG